MYAYQKKPFRKSSSDRFFRIDTHSRVPVANLGLAICVLRLVSAVVGVDGSNTAIETDGSAEE